MATPSPVDEILELLRANGGRVTSSRRAILEAMSKPGGHLTAEEITALVQRRLPDVHESTVYRFLDDLEQLGIVDHVHLGHGPAVYHFMKDAHSHLVCQRCDAVVEIPSQMLADLKRKVRAQHDFEVDLRHFGIPGLCRACRGDLT